MAASNAKSGNATIFRRAGTAIAEVKNIEGPNESRDTHDISHMESPDGAMEFLGAALVDGGEVTLSLQFLPNDTGHQNLRADLYTLTAVQYSITWPGSLGSVTFNGWVTSFDRTTPHNDVMTAEVTIKITGKPTFA